LETDSGNSFKNLAAKIRLQRGVHDISLGRLMFYSNALKIINVVFSCFVTLIVFADFGLVAAVIPSFSGLPAMILVGILSFIILIANIMSDVFNVNSRITRHVQAIDKYTELLKDIINLKQREHDLTVFDIYNDRYLEISRYSNGFLGYAFDEAKKKYYMKIAIAHAIKINPFLSRNKIKKIAVDSYREVLERERRL